MIYRGNIQNELSEHPEQRGWIIGSFIEKESPLHNSSYEIKWVEHKAGEKRVGSIGTASKKSTDIILEGECLFRFPSHNREYHLYPGDFVIYDTSTSTHEFEALTDTKHIVIRES